MSVKDPELFKLVDKIANQVDIMLNNGFIRKALTRIELPHEFQTGMDILVSRSGSYTLNGYLFDELYRGIIGIAMWTYRSRTDVLPDLKYRLSHENLAQVDVLREQMAINNLSSNLAILADQINDLYVKTVELDKASHIRKPPVYQRMNSRISVSCSRPIPAG